MKRLILSALLAVVATLAVYAEKGDFSPGLQFSYASKNSMIGLGFNLQAELIKNFRVQPEFIYYFENKGLSNYNANFNFHYLITSPSGFTIYPMAGFSFVNFKDKVTDTNTKRYGANVGLGAEYSINNQFRFYTEQRFHIIKDWYESVTCLGLRYVF